MPSSKPEGYFHSRSDDGSLTVHENDPGLGACRIHWKPYGNFDEDREHEFRISMENWEKICVQKAHEVAVKQARLEAERAKIVKHGPKHQTGNVQPAPSGEGGGPGF